MSDQSRGSNSVVGLAALGPSVVGVAALVGALVPFFNGEFVAAGMFLLASALSFGSLSLAVLRR